MRTFYIVVDARSDRDYNIDDPTVLFVSDDYKKAKDFFDSEISNWEALGNREINFHSNCVEWFDEARWFYECSDFENDSHRIMKLVEKEIQ